MSLSPVAFGIAADLPRRDANEYVAARESAEAATRRYRPTMAELVARYGAPRGGAGASWYVRKGGSDSNGGSSASLTADRSGTDMSVTNGSTQVTSATLGASAGGVGKGINIAGVLYRIATYTNATTIQLERTYAGTTGSGKTWAIGGALLTIGKIPLTAAAILQGGDFVYIGAGRYGETVTFAMTSLASEVQFIGDVDGSHTGDPGEVIWSGFTSGQKSAPSASALISLTSKNYLTFRNMLFISGSGPVFTTTLSYNLKVADCVINALRAASGNSIFSFANTTGVHTPNWTIENCVFVTKPSSSSNHRQILFSLARDSSPDYDLGSSILVRNCYFQGGFYSILFSTFNAGAGLPGGGRIEGCYFTSQSYGVATNDAGWSTTYPIKVYNCYHPGTLNIGANTSGQIAEDYNILENAGLNVTAGAHSITNGSYEPALELGQAWMQMRRQRPWMQPSEGSPFLGFGGPGGGPANDLMGVVRPAGGGSPLVSVGPYERLNTGVVDTVTKDAGAGSWRFLGPGARDYEVLVDAAPTTITVRVRHDSTYAGSLPSVKILRGGECGVADQEVASTAAADTWETVTVGPFTPTKPGIITLRIRSYDTNGAGGSWFDTVAAS